MLKNTLYLLVSFAGVILIYVLWILFCGNYIYDPQLFSILLLWKILIPIFVLLIYMPMMIIYFLVKKSTKYNGKGFLRKNFKYFTISILIPFVIYITLFCMNPNDRFI